MPALAAVAELADPVAAAFARAVDAVAEIGQRFNQAERPPFATESDQRIARARPGGGFVISTWDMRAIMCLGCGTTQG